MWQVANALRRLTPEQTLHTTWEDWLQVFWWVNDIGYRYGPNERLRLHVVVCDERWTTCDRDGNETEGHARFAWVSGTPPSARGSCATVRANSA